MQNGRQLAHDLINCVVQSHTVCLAPLNRANPRPPNKPIQEGRPEAFVEDWEVLMGVSLWWCALRG